MSIEGIEHTKTKANSPQTNGICERFHKTMKQEFYDVDQWLQQYNHCRAHSGKYCYGKTPIQTFLDSKHIAIEKSNHSMYTQSSTSDGSDFSDNLCA